MTLVTNFQARYSSTRVLQLSNPDDAAAVVIDTARLQAAADDIEFGEFPQICGVAYDDTDARHVAVAVLGVEWRLLRYQGVTAAGLTGARTEFAEAAERFALAGGGRDRITPKSSSNLRTNSESTTMAPDFARGNFCDVVPNLPQGGDRRESE